MKLPRFTLRELFLLVVIAAMGCGWWVYAAQGPDRDTYYRAWGLDIAAKLLREKAGIDITANPDGVVVRSPPSAGERFGAVSTHRFE